MYDSISVLAEAFGKILRKKPDFFGSPANSGVGGFVQGGLKGTSSSSSSNSSISTPMREVHCATGRDFTDSPVPFELGEKIAKFIRKVSEERKNEKRNGFC